MCIYVNVFIFGVIGTSSITTALYFSNAGLGRPLVKMSDGLSVLAILNSLTSSVTPVVSSLMRYTLVSMCRAQLYMLESLLRNMHALLSWRLPLLP